MMKEVYGITRSLADKTRLYLRCEDGFCATASYASTFRAVSQPEVLTLGGKFVNERYPLILPGELL